MNQSTSIDSFAHLIKPTINKRDPDITLEHKLHCLGCRFVAGVDEAGRGPLAGPVVAAAVILDKENLPTGLRDSKQLSAQRRSELYHHILEKSHVAIATASSSMIDAINIREATLKCMRNAVKALPIIVDWSLIDGRDIPQNMTDKAPAVIKGDQYSMSIAAASIIAKVVRDHIMIKIASTYPIYGFEKHKGYGTATHKQAIARHGPCPIHRFSFAPISTLHTHTT